MNATLSKCIDYLAAQIETAKEKNAPKDKIRMNESILEYLETLDKVAKDCKTKLVFEGRLAEAAKTPDKMNYYLGMNHAYYDMYTRISEKKGK